MVRITHEDERNEAVPMFSREQLDFFKEASVFFGEAAKHLLADDPIKEAAADLFFLKEQERTDYWAKLPKEYWEVAHILCATSH